MLIQLLDGLVSQDPLWRNGKAAPDQAGDFTQLLLGLVANLELTEAEEQELAEQLAFVGAEEDDQALLDLVDSNLPGLSSRIVTESPVVEGLSDDDELALKENWESLSLLATELLKFIEQRDESEATATRSEDFRELYQQVKEFVDQASLSDFANRKIQQSLVTLLNTEQGHELLADLANSKQDVDHSLLSTLENVLNNPREKQGLVEPSKPQPGVELAKDLDGPKPGEGESVTPRTDPKEEQFNKDEEVVRFWPLSRPRHQKDKLPAKVSLVSEPPSLDNKRLLPQQRFFLKDAVAVDPKQEPHQEVLPLPVEQPELVSLDSFTRETELVSVSHELVGEEKPFVAEGGPVDSQETETPLHKVTTVKDNRQQPTLFSANAKVGKDEIFQLQPELDSEVGEENNPNPLESEESVLNKVRETEGEVSFLDKPRFSQAYRPTLAKREVVVETSNGSSNFQTNLESAISETARASSQSTDASESLTKASDPMDIYSQIVKEMETVTLSRDQGEVRIQLKPEHLGDLRIRVVVEHGVVTAELSAETEAVREIIAAQLPQLRSNMQQMGLNVSQVHVNVNSEGQQDRQQTQARQNEKMRVKKISSQGESRPGREVTQTSHLGYSQIDYRV